MNLGFDLDEVISKTAQMAVGYCNYELKTDIKVENFGNFWFNDNIFDLDEKKQKAICNALTWAVHSEEMMADIKPYEDAVKYLKRLKKLGHNIYIITKREREFKDMTATWLLRHNISFTKLVHTDGEEKSKYIRNLHLDCYVDDHIPNLEDMAQAQSRWRKGLMLISRPWNDWIAINPDIITRVHNWSEVMRNIDLGNRLK